MGDIGKIFLWGFIGLIVLSVIGMIIDPDHADNRPSRLAKRGPIQGKIETPVSPERRKVQRDVDKCRSDLKCLGYASYNWINYCMNEGARKVSNREFGTEICLSEMSNICNAVLKDYRDRSKVCSLQSRFDWVKQIVR